MSVYRGILGGPSTSWNFNTILGFSFKSAHTGNRKLNPCFWAVPEAKCFYFIAILIFFHMQMKTPPILSCQNSWILSSSEKSNACLKEGAALQKFLCISEQRKKMSMTVHLCYRMNVLIAHGFSQLRTLDQGFQKILRVWKEESWLVTEHSTPKSFSPPSSYVTLGKPLDLSMFFHISSFLMLFSLPGMASLSYLPSLKFL